MHLLFFLDIVKSTDHNHSVESTGDNFLVRGNVLTLFRCTVLFIYYYLLIDINISNLVSPRTQVPSNGSSRSTGGILHGRALGNSFNIGDSIDEVPQEVRPLSNGRINITIVQQPPSDNIIENATSHLNVKSPCFETLGPLLKKVAKSYSPVRSKHLIISKYTKYNKYLSQITIIESIFWIRSSGLSWAVIML
jgi:hypothetical protein